MKTIDQCPTKKKPQSDRGAAASGLASAAGAPSAAPVTGTGQRYWRSVEEFSGQPEFREWVEREFPSGASELLAGSRRTFVKLMAASVALAGAATIPGCRRPDQKVMTYSRRVPEEVIPGQPLYYATSLPLPGGGAEGLLVETHTARPTHIAGNPLHPVNQGAASVRSQASILSVYDPDRLKDLHYWGDRLEGVQRPAWEAVPAGARPTWADFFFTWLPRHLEPYRENGGRGLAFVVSKKTSPSRDWIRDRLLERFPNATWVAWDPAERRAGVEGTRLAFGRPAHPSYRLGRVKAVLALDSNFLEEGPDALRNAREFARTRRSVDGAEGRGAREMSRLYVAESMPSNTGSLADHRLRMSPSRITAFAVAVARELLAQQPAQGSQQLRDALAAFEIPDGAAPEGGVPDFTADLVREIVRDLVRANTLDETAGQTLRGALVVAGDSQPPEVHALVCAMNEVLGAVGQTVVYHPISEETASDSAAAFAAFAEAMDSGAVTTAVFVDTNPVYDAPGELNFADRLAAATKRGLTPITWSVNPTETGGLSVWELNGASYLEAWGDTRTLDGTVAPVQPMIRPIFEDGQRSDPASFVPAPSELELLAMFAGEHAEGHWPDGYDITRRAWGEQLGQAPGSPEFERTWRRALHDGVVPGTTRRGEAPRVDLGSVARALAGFRLPAPPAEGALDVVFRTAHVGDGRDANNAWLQEMPQMSTSVVWDNPVLMSPATARRLGLEPDGGLNNMYTERQLPRGRRATLRVGGREMDVACWVLPGMPDDTLVVTLGYGRERCGRVGEGVGHNTFSVKPAGRMAASGAEIRRAAGWHTIASTQNHWSMESRTSIVRDLDLPFFLKHAGGGQARMPDPIYGEYVEPTGETSTIEMNLAEQLGELSHTPKNLTIYVNPQAGGRGEPRLDTPQARLDRKDPRRPDFTKGPQWGMSIDQTVCTGCGSCVVACQSENNIPVVGKAEVAKGREMHWLRVDRYFTGADMHNPTGMVFQPMMCVHCENAPCETVCPVNATAHGAMGTNDMAYNRCIGTRYCANNCPYKVRRFNFFDWGQTKLNGGLDPDYVTRGLAEKADGALRKDRGLNQNFIPPRLRAKLDELQQMRHNPDVTVRSRGVMEKCTYCIQRVNEARQESKIRGIWGEGEAMIPDGMVATACEAACPTQAIVFGDILDPNSRVRREKDTDRTYMVLGYLNTRPRTTHKMRVNNPNEQVLRLTLTPEQFAARMVDPLEHGHGHSDGSGDHDAGGDHGHFGDDHAHDGAPQASAFFSRVRKAADSGYALSLNVLGGA